MCVLLCKSKKASSPVQDSLEYCQDAELRLRGVGQLDEQDTSLGHYSVRGGILELSEDLRCAAWPTGCGYSGIDPIKQEFREAFRAERAGRRNGEGDVVSLVQPQIVLQRGPSSSRIIFAQSGNSNRELRSMRLLQLLRTRRYNSRAHRSGTKQHNSWSLKVGFSDSQRRAQGVHKSRRQRRAVVSRRRATGSQGKKANKKRLRGDRSRRESRTYEV